MTAGPAAPDASAPDAPAPDAVRRSGLDTVTEMARRFAAGDGPGAAALFCGDIVIEQPASLPHGGRWSGRTGMADMGAAFGKHWTRTVGSPRIIGSGDSVAQVTTQTWTSVATGRAATVDVVELFSFRDGLVSEIRVFQQDTHLLLETLDADAAGDGPTR